MAKGLIWAESAKIDRIEIIKYWNERTNSKRYSNKLNEIISNHIQNLLKYPYLGKQTDIEYIRTFPFGNYSIFYEVTNSSIILHRIWNNSKDPDSLNL